MKKLDRIKLNDSVENNINIEYSNEILTKEFIQNSSLRLIGLITIFILSIIFINRLDKLSKMTSNAIFGNEFVLGATTYFILLLLVISLCLGVLIYGLFLKKNEDTSSILTLKKKNSLYSIYDLGGFILSSIVYLLFIITIVVTPCTVTGDSMQNTYFDDDRVLVWNLGYEANNGDVIVFDASDYSYLAESEFFIKRIVAKENDVINYEKIDENTGKLIVNGEIKANLKKREYLIITDGVEDEFIIPLNKILVLGDNRGNSHDSRNFGLIDEKDIIGKVIIRFYPFNTLGNPDPIIKE